jgi:predicted metalloprotease with PDZ domain
MRIYWSGAAMMLEADMALREETGGQQTLDSALQQLNDCCLEDGKRWSARELLDRLDQLTGSNVFGAVFDEHVDSMSFPDLEERYDALGLVERDGQIRLSGQAPLVEIRNGIMRGGSADSSESEAWDNAP